MAESLSKKRKHSHPHLFQEHPTKAKMKLSLIFSSVFAMSVIKKSDKKPAFYELHKLFNGCLGRYAEQSNGQLFNLDSFRDLCDKEIMAKMG
ncbi:unnamed protein product [Oikopleura dioica]|uniref:Uncharacterized protein n=1 Tax=Oikopleura dioica TaxID=34765 RepID=E4X5W7_OIKDI|nr:unnamed protein product [Oikopleura dioica]